MTTLRPAVSSGLINCSAILLGLGKPEERERELTTLRLALCNGQAERNGKSGLEKKMPKVEGKDKKPSPVVRLAINGKGQGETNGALKNNLNKPALLVSYVYYEAFAKNRERYDYRDWMMDSGAYSAYNSGKIILLDEYIDFCHKLRAEDPTLAEIIALDVIGDDKGSLKNAQKMRKAGLDVIPVFHIGDDWGIFKEYCQGFSKVGISCRFGEPTADSFRFYDQCFARGWPKKFHSFGWAEEKVLMKYPIHSADSTSWEMGPCAFGRWQFFGKLSVRGSKQNLRSQVEWYMDLESRLRDRWKKDMLKLEALDAPTMRFVVGTGRSVNEVGFEALGRAPTTKPSKKPEKRKGK